MSTYVTPSDVEALYEGVLPDRTQALLDRGERQLARLVPDMASRVASAADADGHIDQGLVRDVLVDAVIRVLRNPRGVLSETDGDYSYRVSSGASGSGSIEFTAAELALLRGSPTGTAWSGVGSLLLSPGTSPPRFPRYVRADPAAWTGDEPAGVLAEMEP